MTRLIAILALLAMGGASAMALPVNGKPPYQGNGTGGGRSHDVTLDSHTTAPPTPGKPPGHGSGTGGRKH